DAGAGLAAEMTAVGRADRVFESIGRAPDDGGVGERVGLEVEIGVIGAVDKLRLDLEVAVGLLIGQPEALAIADRAIGRGGVDDAVARLRRRQGRPAGRPYLLEEPEPVGGGARRPADEGGGLLRVRGTGTGRTGRRPDRRLLERAREFRP